MGVMSRRVLPICGKVCFFYPSLRARSRQPVKWYKNLFADIFPRSQSSVGITFCNSCASYLLGRHSSGAIARDNNGLLPIHLASIKATWMLSGHCFSIGLIQGNCSIVMVKIFFMLLPRAEDITCKFSSMLLRPANQVYDRPIPLAGRPSQVYSRPTHLYGQFIQLSRADLDVKAELFSGYEQSNFWQVERFLKDVLVCARTVSRPLFKLF
ncbi:hypothetical protein TEA_006868 [Camellia sinensis var. sinensis]|uniref:Uncharacterized protein n=1 Tax=Camellia sinensis var. sinensis TaxID=542762 RepID=A0A4S4ELH6_CAMSN|nr:hypothetical protein TEA_006868 [Camellia sinensis var. sinensis]